MVCFAALLCQSNKKRIAQQQQATTDAFLASMGLRGFG